MPELDKQGLRQKLTAEREALLASLAGLSEAKLDQRFEDVEGWTSVGDILRHLAGAERGMLTVAQRCARGKPPPDYTGFDLDRYNARQVEKRAAQSVAQTLDEMAASRAELLNFLDGLTEAQLAMPARHPIFGDVTVGQLLRIIASHEGMHRKDIRKLLRR
ncbi:MAG: DinB family protein [Anaerolineae bacterium]